MNQSKKQNAIRPSKSRPKRPTSARKSQKDAGTGGRVAGTRERILDAAERLFGEFGLDATSVRDITRAARANLGAVNYHFGSKQELVLAVFKRRLEPVVEQQLALLGEVLRGAGDKPPRLEAVLEAMIRPTVEYSYREGKPNVVFLRLQERAFSDPNGLVRRLMRDLMQKMTVLPHKLLARAWPALPPEELFWRLSFMNGALHAMRQHLGRKDSLPAVMQKGLDADTMIRRLVIFAAAGIRAGT